MLLLAAVVMCYCAVVVVCGGVLLFTLCLPLFFAGLLRLHTNSVCLRCCTG